MKESCSYLHCHTKYTFFGTYLPCCEVNISTRNSSPAATRGYTPDTEVLHCRDATNPHCYVKRSPVSVQGRFLYSGNLIIGGLDWMLRVQRKYFIKSSIGCKKKRRRTSYLIGFTWPLLAKLTPTEQRKVTIGWEKTQLRCDWSTSRRCVAFAATRRSWLSGPPAIVPVGLCHSIPRSEENTRIYEQYVTLLLTTE